MEKTTLISQSYLFTCPDGEHLYSLAKTHARDFNPADIFWLGPREGEQSIQVEQTLEWAQRVNFGAVGSKKLFIITDVSIMTVAAQNKILKTIEDPRPDTIFLLLATDPSRVLSTIKSRCIQIQIPPPPPKAIPQNILDAAQKLLACKTLDQMLPHLAILTEKENIKIALYALSQSTKDFSIQKTLATIQRNILANANPTNAFDLLVIELVSR